MAKPSRRHPSRADRKRNPQLTVKADQSLTAPIESSSSHSPKIPVNQEVDLQVSADPSAKSPSDDNLKPERTIARDPLLMKELQRIGIVTGITGLVFAVVFVVIRL